MSCDQCVQGYVMNQEPEGQMVGDAYLREGNDKTRAVVLLTDVFGLPLVNCKINADEISKKLDCDVWVPDLFAGRPLFTVDELEPLMPDRAGVGIPFWNKLKFLRLIIPRLHHFYTIRPAVVVPKTESFIKKIKEERGYQKIGAVGYCFGGSICIRIGGKGIVDSLVIAHPGSFTVDQVKQITIPSAWECAEEDNAFPHQMRVDCEAVFAARKDKEDFVEYEFVDYKGTAHGFAARPNFALPDIAEAYQKALDHTIAWFEKTLSV